MIKTNKKIKCCRHIISFTICSFLIFACSKNDSEGEEEEPQIETKEVSPEVTTLDVTNIFYNTATIGAKIHDKGSSSVTKRGICYNTTGNPTFENDDLETNVSVKASGAYTTELINLESNTIYYIKAFAVNATGVGHGNELTFTTKPAIVPTIENQGFWSNIYANITTVSARIINKGSSDATKRGVCWNTLGNPTIDDDFSVSASSLDDDAFITEIPNLQNNVMYYARMYSINKEGVGYGEDITFTSTKAAVNYTLHKNISPSATELEMYGLIEAAMNKGCEFYSEYAPTLARHLNVYYNSGVATADGNSNGTIRFGARSSMNYITAMHEIAHTFGVGTKSSWSTLLVNGVYGGTNANTILRDITGDNTSEIHGDGSHFWPYGLNFTSEVNSDDDLINHCKIVEAMIKDGL